MTADFRAGTPQATRSRISPQLVVGLLVVAVGVLFTLDNLGFVDAGDYLRYWPAALTAIGLVKLWQSRDGRDGAFGGVVFTLIGTWLLLEQTTVIRIQFADIWPLLLVLFGGYLVWQGVASPRRATRVRDDDTISGIAVLGAVTRGSNSRAFRGGDLTAIMGGCEIDLRQAAINGDAVMDLFAMWGGIEIRVPEDWTVISRVTPILGGVEDKTRRVPGVSVHKLVLRGFAIMGGIEVKN